MGNIYSQVEYAVKAPKAIADKITTSAISLNFNSAMVCPDTPALLFMGGLKLGKFEV